MTAKSEAIRLYLDEGLRPYQIAPLVGAAQSTVQQWIRRYRIDAGEYTNQDNLSRPPPSPPPRDTRDLTGRLAGDPMPGRSALDQRRSA